jgi:O-antigen ligase
MTYKSILHKLQNFAMYLLFFSIPFERWKPFNTDVEFLVTKITVIFYMFTVLFEFGFFFSFKKHKKVFLPILIYFSILTVVSFINKGAFSSSFFDVLLFLNILLFVLGTNHFSRDPRVIYKCFLAFMLSAVLLTVFYFLNIEIDNSLDGRIAILGDNQNNIGLNLTCAIFILTSLVFENKSGWGINRLMLLWLLPFLFFVMVITGSRLAFLSSFLGLLFFLLLWKSKFTAKKIVIVIVGLLMVGSVFAYLATNEIIASRLSESLNSGDLGNRDYIWVLILPLISDAPLFGIGITGYANQMEILFGGMISPHNGIIEALCYTGLAGTTFLLLFIFRLLKHALMTINQNNEILPVILFIPIIGILLTGQIFQSKTIWLLFAYVAAAGCINIPVIRKKSSTT